MGLSQNEAALFVLGGRRISGHGAEALFDGACFDARLRLGVLSNDAFFNARLHVRLFKVKKSSKKSKIQVRVQHFRAEKLDNELNIKWERTFLKTCSKTGDVFLRQLLFI